MDPILLSKNFKAKAETTEDGSPGEFTALVSAFGNEDSQGDIVEAGAFTNTLAEWTLKGLPIPVVWSHQFQDPENFLGHYTAAEETEAGLQLTGLLDLDHPKAARVHQLMKSGLIVEFSISGRVRDYELIEKDEDEDEFWGWFAPMRIKDIDLWEAGPCFKGANANTELISIKGRTLGQLGLISEDRSREALKVRRLIHEQLKKNLPLVKEGRVLAQKHVDALKEAHANLGAIIAAVEKSPDPDDAAGAEKARNTGDGTVLRRTPKVRALLDLNTIH